MKRLGLVMSEKSHMGNILPSFSTSALSASSKSSKICHIKGKICRLF